MTGMANHTILLVEDDGPVRDLFIRALRGAGYRVIEARNGKEALDILREHGAAIDLLVTDMRMPHVDGAELVAEVRRQRNTVKVLCVSAFPVLEEPQCDKFLSKPFSNAAFLAAVRELLFSSE
jgi:two-component system cell cycle sensor histidine kinase/response regulator CckA